MARYHSGGFVNSQFYFNIGTENARGRDGDTARLAAKKYNDHRHSAYMAVSPNDLKSWRNEVQEASTDPNSGNPGGLLEDANEYIRLPGDLAELNSVLYVSTSSSVKSISSGFGVHLDTTVPAIVEDFVSSNYTMMRTPTPLAGLPCNFAPDINNNLVPFRTKIADCVIYPTTRAGSGTLTTEVVVTAAIKVSDAPPQVNNFDLSPFRVGVHLIAKYSPYDEATQRITSSIVTDGPQTLITSLTEGQQYNTISNRDDEGYTVVGVLSLPGNFEGLIELDMVFDLDGCYTVAEYVAEAGRVQSSLDELRTAISAWAQDHVKLDLKDAITRVLCTFRGQ